MIRTVGNLLGLLLLAGSWALPAAAQSYAPRVGERHADFVLPRIDNRRPVALSSFHGRKVLLIQFASW